MNTKESVIIIIMVFRMEFGKLNEKRTWLLNSFHIITIIRGNKVVSRWWWHMKREEYVVKFISELIRKSEKVLNF
jgi:hypothetical protein